MTPIWQLSDDMLTHICPTQTSGHINAVCERLGKSRNYLEDCSDQCMQTNSENGMTQLNIYCISNHVRRNSKRKGLEGTGNEMKSLETGITEWLITAQRHPRSPMPGVNSDTLVAHVAPHYLHDDSLQAAVSGPAVPSCCQSGSHGTLSN